MAHSRLLNSAQNLYLTSGVLDHGWHPRAHTSAASVKPQNIHHVIIRKAITRSAKQVATSRATSHEEALYGAATSMR